MSQRYIFHLAFPVNDLQQAKEFYCDILGAKIGRENPDWLDILIWGHQITLHYLPDNVLAKDEQGKRHFGVVLPWDQWTELSQQVAEKGGKFLQQPFTTLMGTDEEQGKFYLEDPSSNVIEIKTYRDFSKTLRQVTKSYSY